MSLLSYWLKRISVLLISVVSLNSFSQTNIENLLSQSDWDSLFPNRAGLAAGHPQGYTSDFYSYDNFITAVEEMSDYLVEIRLKEGLFDALIIISLKSSGTEYIYSDVESWWHSSSAEETIIEVDFEDFLNTPSGLNNSRELGAFLSNISKETTGGWEFPIGGGSNGDYANWGLYWVHELGYTSKNSAGAYSQASSEFPPNPGVGYYGRGPIQLSWNYNYGQLSKFLFNDASILLNNPDLLQEDGVLAFKSAVWFWMMPQCPKPSCHQVMHDLWEANPNEYVSEKMYKKGFAHTNNIINGGLECRSASTPEFTQKVILRSELYKYYLGILGFSANQVLEEDAGEYTTLCYESNSSAMENYLSCNPASGLVLANHFIGNESLHSEPKVYPNPASDFLIIENDNAIDSIELINSIGVRVRQFNSPSNHLKLEVNELEKGIYILSIQTKGRVYHKSLVIN